jgi:hypothetical protein
MIGLLAVAMIVRLTTAADHWWLATQLQHLCLQLY